MIHSTSKESITIPELPLPSIPSSLGRTISVLCLSLNQKEFRSFRFREEQQKEYLEPHLQIRQRHDSNMRLRRDLITE